MSNGDGAAKRMHIGIPRADYHDITWHINGSVSTNGDGFADLLRTADQVMVWVPVPAAAAAAAAG